MMNTIVRNDYREKYKEIAGYLMEPDAIAKADRELPNWQNNIYGYHRQMFYVLINCVSHIVHVTGEVK